MHKVMSTTIIIALKLSKSSITFAIFFYLRYTRSFIAILVKKKYTVKNIDGLT